MGQKFADADIPGYLRPNGLVNVSKTRPWVYDDYLALSWHVREGSDVYYIAHDLHRGPAQIKAEIPRIPWKEIKQDREIYRDWCQTRGMI